MKTITFFSEKGGVGKSSFSILYASWLKYRCGVKCAMADFNHRIENYRNEELKQRKILMANNRDVKPFDMDNAWPIISSNLRTISELKKKEGIRWPNAEWFNQQLEEGKFDGCDVVICDFPGSLSGMEFSEMIITKKIGLVVIPTERDTMTTASTLKIDGILKNARIPYCCFVNKAQVNLRNFKNVYVDYAAKLRDKGVPVLPDMISYSERMLTIDKVDIIRSTFSFPDFESPKYASIGDIGIENLFIDITKLLSKTDDLIGTVPRELTFVNDMKKKADGRQLKESSFPEFDM